MEQESLFKLIVMIVLGFAIIIAVLIFAGVIPGFDQGANSDKPSVPIVVWGSVPADRNWRDQIEILTYSAPALITYVYKDDSQLERDLLEALAIGEGPDLLLVSEDFLIKHRNKLFVIPFDTIKAVDYRDWFAPASEVFMTRQGILALPLAIDPLMMYYNQDLYSVSGLSQVPKTWSGYLNIHKELTKTDSLGLLTQSGIAFGEASNINNFSSIIETLLLQAGNPITQEGEGGEYEVVLESKFGYTTSPMVASLAFYTSFSDPQKSVYSWNETLPLDQDLFLAGKLVNYFGYASEFKILQNKNPNLNLKIAEIPQRDNLETRKVTKGKVLAIGIIKNSEQPLLAFNTAWYITNSNQTTNLITALNLPPARTDLLNKPLVSDLSNPIFYQSAIYAQTWANPDFRQTKAIWTEMINGTNRQENFSDVIRVAEQKLKLLFN